MLSRQHAVRRVYRLEDIQSDFVIADATWFVWDNPQDINNAVQSFVECGFPRVLLYGSEHSFMSFPSLLRDALTDACTWVTHNCKYQRNLYRMCGIYDSVYLCDPVPEDIFYPGLKQNRIFASGQISHEKSSEALIRLFELLRHSGIETCYAGSATTWGDKTSALGQDFHSPERSKDRFRLQQDLEDVTDVFLGDVTQATAARYSNSARYHVHVAHHDTSQTHPCLLYTSPSPRD